MSDRRDAAVAEMEYESPKITVLGSLAALTIGAKGQSRDNGTTSN